MMDKEKFIKCVGIMSIATLNMDVSSDGLLEIGIKGAIADDDVEIIVVTGTRYAPPNYYAIMKSFQYDYDMYDGGASAQAEHYEYIEETCYKLMRKQPVGCSSANPPSLAPNGCSTEFAGVDFFNSWDNVFRSACNSHDKCYVNMNSQFGACNESMRQDMLDICSERNAEAIINGTLFDTSECWSKSSEYYAGVELFGSSFYEKAQKDAACVSWGNSKREFCGS